MTIRWPAFCVLLLPLGIIEVTADVVKVVEGYEVTYPKGKIGGSSGSGVPASYINLPPAKEYYLDYQVLFTDDWEWVKGGKLPGLVGGKHTSGCRGIEQDGWSCRFMWRGGGAGMLYIYHQNRKSGCGDDYHFSDPGNFTKGKWNRITERVVINTPGKNDGIVEAWLNGEKKASLTTMKLRGNVGETVALVDQLSLQTFYGGSSSSWAPPHDTHARYSKLVVRTDLPDFSKSFEEFNNDVAIRPVTRARARAGAAKSVVYMGRGGLPMAADADANSLMDIRDARGGLLNRLQAVEAANWDGLDAHGRPVQAGLLILHSSP